MLIFELFASINDIIKTYNLMVIFSKFTLNITTYEEFVEFLFKLIWREILLLKNQTAPKYL